MYSIYSKVGSHRICLHDDTVSSQEVKVLEPVLTLEDNNAGSLTFKLAPNNQAYGSVIEHEEVASGIGDAAEPEVIDSYFVNGTIDDTGNQQLSSTNLVTNTFFDVSSTASMLGLTITSRPGFHDIYGSLITGSEEDPTDTSVLRTLQSFDVRDHLDIYKFSCKTVDHSVSLTNEFIQGLVQDADFTVPTNYGISTTSIDSTNKDHFNILVTVANEYSEEYGDLEWCYYAYMENGDLAFNSGWLPADGTSKNTFKPPTANQTFDVYRLAIRRKDGGELLLENISSIDNLYTRDVYWRLAFYDLEMEYIGASNWKMFGTQQNITKTDAKYYTVEISYDTFEEINQNDFVSGNNTVTIENITNILWGIAGYDSDGTFIAKTQWYRSDDSVSIATRFPGVSKVKFLAAYAFNDYSAHIDPSELTLAMYRQSYVTTTIIDKEIDMVARMQSTITVYRKDTFIDPNTNEPYYEDVEIWEGRPLTEDRDFYNVRSIYCEGELAYLNDTCQPQREYKDCSLRQFIEAVLNYHNSRVSSDKQFFVGQIWVTDESSGYDSNGYRYTQYQKTMEVINDLVSNYGGHIKIRKQDGKRYLDWFADYGEDNNTTQTIEFSKNLLEYSANWDMTELCTVLLPTGHVVEQAQSTSVGDPLPLNGGAGPTPNQLLYQDKNTKEVYIQANPGLGGYKTAVAQVEPEKNYYFSGRLHGGFVAYTIKSNADGSGDYYEGGTKTAGTEGQVGFVDFIDQKITIPPGAHSVVMCSFGDDIPLSLKSEVEAREGLDKYLTVEECADDEGWHQQGSLYVVNQEAVNTYGWIEKQMAQSDIEDADLLYQTAKLYLQDGQFDQMTLELTAIDMNLLGVRTDFIGLLDNIRVISKPHGLDRYFPVTKLEIPLDKPAEQKFTLGTNTSQSLTSVNNDLNADMLDRIAGLPTMTQMLTSAKANSAEMINNASTGFVSTLMDERTGKPYELVISENELIKTDTGYTSNGGVWRWNSAGLGYSSNGYKFSDGNLQIALTANGQIVADVIKTGTLQGITVQGCKLIAGGYAAGDYAGTVLVKTNGIGNSAVQLDNGSVMFGTYSAANDTFTRHSDIKGDIDFEVEPGTLRDGTRISTPVLALDTDYIWVSSGSGGGDPRAGVNQTLVLVDNNGNNQRFTIRRGIIVGIDPV